MANQSHSGIHKSPWYRCQRCGLDTPTAELRWQNGLLICQRSNCVDNPIAWNRPGIIQGALEGSSEEMGVAEVLRSGPQEPEPQI